MKLTRTGRFRKAGTKVLAEADLSATPPSQWTGLNYSEKDLMFTFQASGEDNNSNYNYRLYLSAAELLYFLGITLDKAVKDNASKAVGKGAIATLKALVIGEAQSETKKL